VFADAFCRSPALVACLAVLVETDESTERVNTRDGLWLGAVVEAMNDPERKGVLTQRQDVARQLTRPSGLHCPVFEPLWDSWMSDGADCCGFAEATGYGPAHRKWDSGIRGWPVDGRWTWLAS
jgi:hypothetical protein